MECDTLLAESRPTAKLSKGPVRLERPVFCIDTYIASIALVQRLFVCKKAVQSRVKYSLAIYAECSVY
jgi:hypothetical protein